MRKSVIIEDGNVTFTSSAVKSDKPLTADDGLKLLEKFYTEAKQIIEQHRIKAKE